MATDHIRYDLLAQQALRGVVRAVLVDAAKNGLPGEHHFYITFHTRAPGIRLPQRLLEQYPQEMTIILQHQFWDLKVSGDAFEVGLSFGGIPERLGIPFEAITRFVDPSVQFGLQFDSEEGATVADAPAPAGLVSVAPSPQAPSATDDAPAPAPAAEAKTEPEPEPTGGAEVVRLDRFRKKDDRGRTEDGTKRR
jgi:hypothetical protein